MATPNPARRTRKPRSTDTGARAAAPNPRRQRVMRDVLMIAIAPLLLYLLAILVTYSPEDHLGLTLDAFKMLVIKDGNWTIVQ